MVNFGVFFAAPTELLKNIWASFGFKRLIQSNCPQLQQQINILVLVACIFYHIVLESNGFLRYFLYFRSEESIQQDSERVFF
jgi:hypothetical protein